MTLSQHKPSRGASFIIVNWQRQLLAAVPDIDMGMPASSAQNSSSDLHFTSPGIGDWSILNHLLLEAFVSLQPLGKSCRCRQAQHSSVVDQYLLCTHAHSLSSRPHQSFTAPVAGARQPVPTCTGLRRLSTPAGARCELCLPFHTCSTYTPCNYFSTISGLILLRDMGWLPVSSHDAFAPLNTPKTSSRSTKWSRFQLQFQARFECLCTISTWQHEWGISFGGRCAFAGPVATNAPSHARGR